MIVFGLGTFRNIMGKTSKKGRITGSQRKEMNARVVSSVLEDTSEDIIFGRVLRHLGQGHVRVMLADKREGIAKIRTALARRGSTPIVSDDIVVLSDRDFETHADTKLRFDLLAVMTRAEASKLEKAGRIPAWFLQVVDGDGKIREEEGGDLFDYSDMKEISEDEDIDIDRI